MSVTLEIQLQETHKTESRSINHFTILYCLCCITRNVSLNGVEYEFFLVGVDRWSKEARTERVGLLFSKRLKEASPLLLLIKHRHKQTCR